MLGESLFSIVQRKNVAVIEVTGELDIANAGQFEDAFERALTGDPEHVVISLMPATYFDSIGVHSLLRFAERLKTTRRAAHGRGSGRRDLPPGVGNPGVAAVYSLFDSVDLAIASLTRQKPAGGAGE